MYETAPYKNQRWLSVRWIPSMKATKNGLQLQDNLKNTVLINLRKNNSQHVTKIYFMQHYL